LAIQYSVSHPQVATTLVSTASPAHVAANLAWIDQPIDMQMCAEVMAILAPVQNESWQTGRPENNYCEWIRMDLSCGLSEEQ
jgi:predicted aldo/keto reductase-like oxidoreductase